MTIPLQKPPRNMHKIDLINFLRDFFQIYIAPCRCQLNLSHARCVRKGYISSLVLGWLLSLLQNIKKHLNFECLCCVWVVFSWLPGYLPWILGLAGCLLKLDWFVTFRTRSLFCEDTFCEEKLLFSFVYFVYITIISCLALWGYNWDV